MTCRGGLMDFQYKRITERDRKYESNGYEEGFHDLQEEIDELLKEYEDEKSRN